MSRLRGFLLSVTSGYASILASTLFSLASIPLALAYLSTEEFGIWVLTSQMAIYLGAIDLGMGSAIARLLIDAKDQKATGTYAEMLTTSWALQLLQAVGILLVAPLFIWAGPLLFSISPSLVNPFRSIIAIQAVVLAFRFATLLFEGVLSAHQRLYIINTAQIVYFAVGYGLWFFLLARGRGLVGMALATGASTVLIAAIHIAACLKFGLLPRLGHRSMFSQRALREIFQLGRDTYLATLGSQLIMASQTILLGAAIGVSASAVWSIATRPFLLAGQVVWRFFDSSLPALGEMFARKEDHRLGTRFEDLIQLSGLMGVGAGAMLIVANQPFLALWTHGRIHWAVRNDMLLAVWLVLLSVTHGHGMLILASKRLAGMRYVYFAEGLAFISSGYVAARYGGITWMILCSLLCSVVFHGNYVLRRTSALLGRTFWETGLKWQRWAIIAGVVLFPLALAVNRLSAGVPALGRLFLGAGIIGIGFAGLAWVFARRGLADPGLLDRLWKQAGT